MTPFDKELRRALTPKRRAELFSKQGGKCQNCKRKIRPGERWDLDHRVALINQGNNDEENLQVLCQNCHAAKTPRDHAEAATSRRKYIKNTVPSRFRKRGFGFSRKFNGDVEIY